MSTTAIGLFVFLCTSAVCAAVLLFTRIASNSKRTAVEGKASAAPQTPIPKWQGPIDRLLRQAGLRVSPLLGYGLIALCLGGGILLASILHLPWLFRIATGLGCISLLPTYLSIQKARRQQKFLEQLPSALELMANALRAGLGVNSAFGITAQEISDPLGMEFSQFVAELNLGSSMEEALDHLVERNKLNDVRLLSQAILIHKQVGGNLAEVLDNLDKTIRERFYLRRELTSMTIEQQLSAWILCGLPLVMAIAMSTMNHDYLRVFTTTKEGHILLIVAVVLQVAGVLLLRWILHVDI